MTALRCAGVIAPSWTARRHDERSLDNLRRAFFIEERDERLAHFEFG